MLPSGWGIGNEGTSCEAARENSDDLSHAVQLELTNQTRYRKQKYRMKKLSLFSLILSASVLGAVAQGQLIDDFSGNLSAYTATRILNNGNHAPVNTYAWEINGGSLQINTTAYTGIEQFALTRTDFSLSVGFELTATYGHANLGTQDIGLYVGAGTPVQDVRADYVNIYMRNNGQLFSRGFDGTTELTLAGGGSPVVDMLFIARTGLTTYDLGYYAGGIRTILTSRTVANSAVGDAIGFYADIRGLGVRGNMDNLSFAPIPEPTTGALLGLGAFAVILARRRRA